MYSIFKIWYIVKDVFIKIAPSYFIPSGDIDLSAYTGKGYIGFKYVGDKTTNTTTFRIDNVKIRKK
jgi:hypothetical protein